MSHSAKIVLASNNAKKVSELLTHLPPHFSLITQAELAIPSPAEPDTPLKVAAWPQSPMIQALKSTHCWVSQAFTLLDSPETTPQIVTTSIDYWPL
jgi:hypothetical protein